MVQWLRFCTLTAKGLGSIPGQGTKIPQAVWPKTRKKKKKKKKKTQSIELKANLWNERKCLQIMNLIRS